jgi:hypothetical protein
MVAGTFGHSRRAQRCVFVALTLIGVWLLGLARLAAAQVPQVDTTHITSVAQDSAGVIWATGQSPGAPPELYRWQGDHWVAEPVRPNVSGAWPEGVWPGPRGGVVVAWGAGQPPGTVFTLQRGNEVKILGKIEAVTTPTGSGGYSTRYFDSPDVTTTSSGEILITGKSPDIYRAEPGGTIRLAYTIQPSQYLPHRQFLNRRAAYLPLHATEDAQGRTWIWSGFPAHLVVSGAILRGFLLAEGKGFDYHAQLPGLPDSQLTCLGRWDKDHFAAGKVDDGLYTIDTSTLTARHITEPEPGAFRFIQQVFYVSNDRYVIASDFGLPQTRNIESGPFGVLWGFRHGRWEKLLTGLDEVNVFPYQLDRPRIETSQGLWLGGWAKGLWFIPSAGKRHRHRRAGAPQHINWKQGFPLGTARRLFALQDGSFLAVDWAPGRTAAVSPNSLLTSAAPAGNLQVIDPFTMLQPDQRLHIWGILSIGGNALDEWDGEKWTAHPLPGNINPAWLSGLDVDSEGRVWLFPDCRMGPMSIFDPHQGRWADYPSYQAALAAHVSQSTRFLHPDADRMKPTYSPSSQIVYNGACQGINYFDGNDWHVWNRPEVPGDPGFSFDGPAFFDAAGHVAVNIHHKTREWRPDLGWQLIPYEPHSGHIVNFFAPHPPGKPPAGCASTESSSLSRDPLGRFWWTWKGSLYEGIPGLCHEALAGNEPQPFIDGRLLRRVMTDSRGNVFLETLSANRRIGQYVFLHSSGELPHTTIHLTKLSGDSVGARFQSSIPGVPLFTWRVDGGDWSAPEKQGRVVLPSLPGGEHRLEAASIDSRLQMDAVPASAGFYIGVTPQEQIPALIARLENAQTDDERKAAVEALARQAASAVLPALKAARARASDDERWWIDAAIQEVTQRAHQSTQAGQER